MRKQHYMTYPERCQLEALHKARLPVREIAAQLGFSVATIYRELKRGEYTALNSDLTESRRYSAEIAQQDHEYSQTAKGRPLKIGKDHDLASYLEQKIMKDRFSPAAALASARKAGFTTRISTNTLYSYIEKKVFLRLRNRHLWRKGKKRIPGARPVSRIAHPKLPSIEERPQEISSREEYGHWEMDLIVGKQGKGPALLTLTERKTRQEIIRKRWEKACYALAMVAMVALWIAGWMIR